MKIAIDIALLPPDDIMEKAISINKELIKNNSPKEPPKIILDKLNSIPHITIAMAVIEEENLPKIIESLRNASAAMVPINIEILSISNHLAPTKEIVSYFEINKTPELQQLHEAIMQDLFSFFSYNLTKDMFVNPEEIDDVTLTWVKGYEKKHNTPSLFKPHITLGIGKINQTEQTKFIASRLAICQFGNYCTCRKILKEI